mmetsp:Transcript_16061/g.38665  ORF Transcript_16061/g.38665 Transcript_16061/m.38665 type:complete len:208 (-) Transcript_16061:1578-2201(-)
MSSSFASFSFTKICCSSSCWVAMTKSLPFRDSISFSFALNSSSCCFICSATFSRSLRSSASIASIFFRISSDAFSSASLLKDVRSPAPAFIAISLWAYSQSISTSIFEDDNVDSPRDNSSSLGSLSRKRWLFPKRTRSFCASTTTSSVTICTPLCHTFALPTFCSETTPSWFVRIACSGDMLRPMSLMFCGVPASGFPTVVRPGLSA